MPEYHGWTHRPKAQGGTDPIDFPGGSVPYALCGSIGLSVTTPFSYNGFVDLEEFGFETNAPDIFSFDDSVVGKAGIACTPGVYYVTADAELAMLSPVLADLPPTMRVLPTSGTTSGGGLAPTPLHTFWDKANAIALSDVNWIQPAQGWTVNNAPSGRIYRLHVLAPAGADDWDIIVNLWIFRLGDSAGA